MQLPRGTFREIKKSELVSSILDEFEHTKFSGICNISSEGVSGTLVFKSGKCILAKIQNKSGDGAWEELQKMREQEIDAALSSLDDAQVQLALEFNKACRIIKAGKTTPVTSPLPQKSASATHTEPGKKHFPSSHSSATVKPDSGFEKYPPASSHTIQPSSPFFAAPSPAKNVIPPPQHRAPAPPQPATSVRPSVQFPGSHPSPSQDLKKPDETENTDQDSSNFETDIDTFDSLDLDNVTDKIRNDCKTMIKQLQLEHLMDR
ncbi:MAG: hypothetical protein Q7T80_18330 [Methanoregula sp.]|nr:hypothetical protein [Methanoregula sp.]